MTRKGKLEREASTVIGTSTDSLHPEKERERKPKKKSEINKLRLIRGLFIVGEKNSLT